MTHADAAWTVIVPVKPASLGKSRLAVAGIDRIELARAIATDTLRAAASASVVREVFVVTDDTELARQVADIPHMHIVPEQGVQGLDAAIARAAATLGVSMPRAAMLGDLPALRGADLDAALRLASGVDRGVVADAESLGSTLVTATQGVTLLTAFGAASYARHLALGFRALDVGADSTLRRDVDTAAHLILAEELGLGDHTAELRRRAA